MFIQNKLTCNKETILTGVCITNIDSIKKGILKYATKGKQALNKDFAQLHDREVFKPVMLSNLTKEEREKAMSSLIF